MSGSTEVAMANPRRARMPGRVGAHRRLDELAELGVVDDRRQQLAGDRVVEAEERAAQQDVLATGQLLVEPGAEGQQSGHVADARRPRLPTGG